MPKIVVLGSCRFEPYQFLAVPNKIPGAWNTEEGYQIAIAKFYPAIDETDEVWVYAPDGVGEHTGRDLAYARSRGKLIRYVAAPRRSSERGDVEDVVRDAFRKRFPEDSDDGPLFIGFNEGYQLGLMWPYPHRGLCPSCGQPMQRNSEDWRCPTCKIMWRREKL